MITTYPVVCEECHKEMLAKETEVMGSKVRRCIYCSGKKLRRITKNVQM